MLSCQRALQRAREQGGAVRLWEELLEEATEQWLGILRRRFAGNTLLYQPVRRTFRSWRRWLQVCPPLRVVEELGEESEEDEVWRLVVESDGLRAASKESSVRAMTRAPKAPLRRPQDPGLHQQEDGSLDRRRKCCGRSLWRLAPLHGAGTVNEAR